MKENILSYTTRIGKTTFIVNVKQSESAKKPLNTVFQEICRHEMLGDFSADNYLNACRTTASLHWLFLQTHLTMTFRASSITQSLIPMS